CSTSNLKISPPGSSAITNSCAAAISAPDFISWRPELSIPKHHTPKMRSTTWPKGKRDSPPAARRSRCNPARSSSFRHGNHTGFTASRKTYRCLSSLRPPRVREHEGTFGHQGSYLSGPESDGGKHAQCACGNRVTRFVRGKRSWSTSPGGEERRLRD